MKSELIKDYRNGMPIKEIKEKHHTTSLYYYLPKSLRRKNKLTKENQNDIINYYLKGEKVGDIADLFDVSQTQIRLVLKGNGIILRHIGRPKKSR